MGFDWHLPFIIGIIPVISSVSLSQKEQEDIRTKCFESFNTHSHFQGWASWTSWSKCSASFGFGIQKRYRNCYSDYRCPVGSYQSKICTTAIHGGWSPWTTYSCSKSCGGGYALKMRSCTNPLPMFGGSNCLGPSVVKITCNTHPCHVPTTMTTTTPTPTTTKTTTHQATTTTKSPPTTATKTTTTTTITTTVTTPPPTTTTTSPTTTTTTPPPTASSTTKPPITTTKSTPTTTRRKFFTIRAVLE